MRNLLLFLICLSLIGGCASTPRVKELEKQVSDLQDTLLKKEIEIKGKDSQLSEKESEITQLRNKLESLGVFQ